MCNYSYSHQSSQLTGINHCSELLWAVYAFIQAAENTSNKSYVDLAKKWQTWIDYTKTTAAHVCKSLRSPFKLVSFLIPCFVLNRFSIKARVKFVLSPTSRTSHFLSTIPSRLMLAKIPVTSMIHMRESSLPGGSSFSAVFPMPILKPFGIIRDPSWWAWTITLARLDQSPSRKVILIRLPIAKVWHWE